jgi:uncharacterized protein DUF2735
MIDDEPNLTRLVAKDVASYGPGHRCLTILKHQTCQRCAAARHGAKMGVRHGTAMRAAAPRKRFHPRSNAVCAHLRGCLARAQRDAGLERRFVWALPIKRAKTEVRELSAIAAFSGSGTRKARAISDGAIIYTLNAISQSRTMNTTNAPQQSAKIFQFPVGGRRAVEGNREETPTTNSFGSWYHDAAIQEAAAQNHREH